MCLETQTFFIFPLSHPLPAKDASPVVEGRWQPFQAASERAPFHPLLISRENLLPQEAPAEVPTHVISQAWSQHPGLCGQHGKVGCAILCRWSQEDRPCSWRPRWGGGVDNRPPVTSLIPAALQGSFLCPLYWDSEWSSHNNREHPFMGIGVLRIQHSPSQADSTRI